MHRTVLKQFSLIFLCRPFYCCFLGKEIEEWRMIIDETNYKCILNCSLAPPLHHAGEGERAEESGDTAIQSVALSKGLSIPIRLLHSRGGYEVM